MSRLPNYVALALAFLAVPEIPWVFLTPDRLVDQFGDPRDFAEAIWIHNVIDVTGFLGAAVLAALRIRFWPVAAVLICGYVAIVATPSFLQLGMTNGFINYLSLVWRHAAGKGFPDGFYSIWNLVILPTVPAVLLAAIPFLWWASRKMQRRAA